MSYIDNNMTIEETKETLQDMVYDPDKFTQAVIWGTDWTTETINNQLLKGNIDLNPSFQRRDAWTDAEKSRLIESLMLGLPVPPIILAENKNKKNSYIVIDGKQRLLSIRRFFSSEEGAQFKPLKLKSLDILKELNGDTIESARIKSPEYITNLENQPIRTIVIKNWPDEPFLYTVFLRLNTGSKKLSPQELRQALKPGRFLDYLDEATANSKTVMKMLNNKSADTRMKDIELALRFFAFYYFFEEYTGNLKDFLDTTCEKLNDNWTEKEDEIKKLYQSLEDAINFSYKITKSESPFSRYINHENSNRFNKSIYELFVYYFSIKEIRNLALNNEDQFMKGFIQMNDDDDFVKAISSTTKDIGNIAIRFEKFYNVLHNLPGSEQITIPRIIQKDGKISIKDKVTI